MSDVPPPPPGEGTPFPPPPAAPPPPPADLVAPPGYSGYRPSPMGSVALQRVGRLSAAVVVLVAVSAAFALASVWALSAAQDDAEQLLADEISTDTFVQRTAPYLLLSLVQAVAVLASAVVTIIWMYRIAANHRTLHRGTTWGPGWAIGGWFLPPLIYVIPFLMLTEMWKASDPTVPIGGDWKSRPASPIIGAWFLLYSIVPLVLLIAQGGGGLGSFGASERDLAEQITSTGSSALVSALVSAVGAATFIALVRGLTTRHRLLTGEATG